LKRPGDKPAAAHSSSKLLKKPRARRSANIRRAVAKSTPGKVINSASVAELRLIVSGKVRWRSQMAGAILKLGFNTHNSGPRFASNASLPCAI